jgi:hypothetical protein
MGFQVSPGVQVKEVDLTNVIPAVSTSIGAFAGHFSWGPGGESKLVSSEKELSAAYGVPTEEADNYVPFLQASSFLKYTTALRVSRALPSDSRNSVGSPYGEAITAYSSAIGNSEAFDDITFGATGSKATNGQVIIGRYPGKLGDSIKVLMANQQVLNTVLENATGVVDGAITSSTTVVLQSVQNQIVNGMVVSGTGITGTPTVTNVSGNTITLSAAQTVANSETLTFTSVAEAGKFSLSDLDSVVSGPATTTAWAENNVLDTQSAGTNTYDELHVVVIDEDGLITGVKNTVLEVFEGLSLYRDALKNGGSNYYKTVINRDSEWIYINETAFRDFFSVGTDNQGAKPGDTGVGGTKFFDNNIVNSRASEFDSYDTTNITGTLVNGTYTVVDGLSYSGNAVTSHANGNSGGLGVGASLEITLSGTAGSVGSAILTVSDANGVNTGGFGYKVDDEIRIPEQLLGSSGSGYVSFDVSFIDSAPSDGVATTEALFDFTLQKGENGTPGHGNITTALDVFNNAEEVDINLVFAEDYGTGTDVGNKIVQLCGTTRKDCVGFLSPKVSSNSSSEVKADLSAYNSSYVVMDSGAVYVYNKYKDEYVYIPASGHIAGLCARTDDTNDPWFSPAGYNRGNLLGVTKLKWNPTKTDRDELYKAGINPIIAQPGQGILLFGDKTAQSKPSAFDRINVRRLFIVLEKAISTASKFQLFELNDEFTRAMFRNMTEPFLRDVKGRRGITDFLVVCDETNNTGEVIDTNRFVADIYIKPARSINFITLNFVATRTGVEFSEIVGTGN